MNINSFVLFGDELQTWAPLFATNIRQHFTLYPPEQGWMLWIHTDRELENNGYSGVLKRLAAEGLIRIDTVPNEGQHYQKRLKCLMMLWRLLPLWSGITNYVFPRDLDSILTPRQLCCVRAFIASGKTIHAILDNQSHNGPLMGGMIGFRTIDFHQAIGNLSFNDLLYHKRFKDNIWDAHGADQDFMNLKLWPMLSHSSLVHRLSGPNERYNLKRPVEADVSDISPVVLEQGDNFTNYIGAVGINGTQEALINFYNEYGHKNCQTIARFEQEAGHEIFFPSRKLNT